MPTHNLGEVLYSGYLMLSQLTQDEVSQLLGFVAKVENSSVLANDTLHLLSDMDDELGLVDCIVSGTYYTHLD